MPIKDFLETYPLYKRHPQVFGETYASKLPKPPVNMWCEKCRSNETFNMTNEYTEGSYGHMPTVPEAVVPCHYTCTSCRSFVRHFWLRFEPLGQGVRKVGQYPAWDISPDSEVDTLLGERSRLYRNGLICESQSFGIAAFAYYRRIVEEIIDELLDGIRVFVPDADKEAYLAALERCKASQVAQEKIEIAKEVLPGVLRPQGMNPLGALHTALSDGLHARTDDHCILFAQDVRTVLEYLVNQIASTRATSEQFVSSMQKLIDAKRK